MTAPRGINDKYDIRTYRYMVGGKAQETVVLGVDTYEDTRIGMEILAREEDPDADEAEGWQLVAEFDATGETRYGMPEDIVEMVAAAVAAKLAEQRAPAAPGPAADPGADEAGSSPESPEDAPADEDVPNEPPADNDPGTEH